jgi:hypothetical protein
MGFGMMVVRSRSDYGWDRTKGGSVMIMICLGLYHSQGMDDLCIK